MPDQTLLYLRRPFLRPCLRALVVLCIIALCFVGTTPSNAHTGPPRGLTARTFAAPGNAAFNADHGKSNRVGPVLDAPSNGHQNLSSPIDFSWYQDGTASSYRLQISTTASFSTTVYDAGNIPSSTTSVSVSFYYSGLERGETYYWRVASVSSSGYANWSGYWTFTTVPPMPGTPSLTSPSDGVTDLSTALTLDWSSASDAETYRVQVATSSSFGSATVVNQHGISATAYTAGGLAQGTTYHWRVRAENAGGHGDWSAAHSFTTVPPRPNAPHLTSPADGAEDVYYHPALDWSSGGGEVDTYRVQVATDSYFGAIVDETTMGSSSTSHNLSLSHATTYHWRVRAENITGSSGWSERSFTTMPRQPDAPTLTAPTDDASNQPLSLSLEWQPVSGDVDHYTVEYKKASQSWSQATSHTTGSAATAYNASGLARAVVYHWRVRAENGGGESVWTTRSFSTVPPLPPRLRSPQDGAVDRELSLTITWDASADAENYRVQVASDAGFNDKVVNATTGGATSRDVSALGRDATYYWRVRPGKNGIWGDWSATRSFTTIPPVPGVPSLAHPAPAATEVPTSPLLEWSAGSGRIDGYDVQIAQSSGFGDLTVSETGLTTTAVEANGLRRGLTYHWRVRATNAGGESDWATRSFTTVPYAPAMPTLASPARGAADVPLVATLKWEASYPAQATEDYEGNAVGWRRASANQGLSTQEAHSGAYSWRVASASGCDGGCAYMTNERFWADELDTDATYVFSAWVKAPVDHDNIHIQFKYRADGQWQYPGGAAKASYTHGGAWQHLEVRIDLSQIAGLELLNPVTRNVGTRAIPAYWDDVQLSVETSPAASYDLQVAKDAAFNALITDVSALTRASYVDTLSRYEADYWWRVRAHNVSGTGPWSAARPITTREAPPRRYYIKDHLGSVRTVVDATGEIKETRDYYPFGLRMPGRSTTEGTPAQEDYTGHERDPQTQLHYAGARYYMSALGRWTTSDPILGEQRAGKLLEKDRRLLTMSPYNYSFNSPTNLRDPDGKCPVCWDIADIGFAVHSVSTAWSNPSVSNIGWAVADVAAAAAPFVPSSGSVRHGAKLIDEGIEITRNSARKLLQSRGVSRQGARDVVKSFEGQIRVRRGKAGEEFIVTESAVGEASGVFVTRGSAGATPAARQENLALPPGNTAQVETRVTLTRDQNLLEGTVAPQPQWGPNKTGGAQQVVTDGGRRTGAVEDLER